MRPTPAEELAGIRRILADTVAPAVAGEYAASQLQHVLLTLERLAAGIETAGEAQLAEEAALRELFARLAAQLPSEGPLATLRRRMAAAESPLVASRGLLADAIAELERQADAPGAADARAAIRAAMRANLDRALNPTGR